MSMSAAKVEAARQRLSADQVDALEALELLARRRFLVTGPMVNGFLNTRRPAGKRTDNWQGAAMSLSSLVRRGLAAKKRQGRPPCMTYQPTKAGREQLRQRGRLPR